MELMRGIYFEMDEHKKKDSMYESIRNTFKRIKRSITVVLVLLFIALATWFVSDFFSKQFQPTILKSKMLDRCMEFINKELDEILLLETRTKQNKAFRQIKTSLPIQPIRMSTTTAVFKYTYTSKPVILKRVIWNKNNGLNEDETCTMLKGKSRYLVNALMSTRSFRMVSNPKDPQKKEKQTLIWIFFEFMDIKINERHVSGSEEVIKHIVHDALLGLKYLHDNNYAHLDIKIANIMGVTQKDGSVQYKLIDFGYTQYFQEKMAVIPRKNYGTYPFKAPEVIKKNVHGAMSDIWALGASVWYMSLGNIMFYDSDGNKDDSEYMRFISNKTNTHNGIKNHRFLFRERTSPELINFVKECMHVDYKKRPTVDELLNHPFITGEKQNLSTSESYDIFGSSSNSEPSR
ncbi:PAKG [Enterospora canceri]|uniref:PAKG n=1 Tax=Enterospora canceri TaxID=1081671 RepID=A0A1Y1S9U3_9MICR|nr:PAKG [Enterospora canceri]